MNRYHSDFARTLDVMRNQRGRSVSDRSLPMYQMAFESDVDVLNYALTLEHLEAAFYEMSGDFDLGNDGFGNNINEWVAVIGEHEAAHVATLTQVITDLGGECPWSVPSTTLA